MITKTLRQTVHFKGASPRKVYDLIMVSRQHASLSREKAVISQRVGGRFSAWNGHITGFNLALRPGRKIVQAWRATGWWPDHYSVATFEDARASEKRSRAEDQDGAFPQDDLEVIVTLCQSRGDFR